MARTGCHQTVPLAHWVFRPFTWPPLLTHLMVGQQWWPSHCPSPISGFQLNSSLWLHNQQEALSAASPHPVNCCLSLLPCHSNGCEHLPHCLSRKASPADLDQEQPCLTLFFPAVVQKVLVFSISIYFSHRSLHGTVRYMRISLCLFRPQYHIQPQSCLDCSLAPRSTVIPFPLQTGLMLFPELIGVSSYCHLCKCHEHIVMAPSVPSLGECCFTPEQDVCHGAPIPTKIAQWVFSHAPHVQVCWGIECVLHWPLLNPSKQTATLQSWCLLEVSSHWGLFLSHCTSCFLWGDQSVFFWVIDLQYILQDISIQPRGVGVWQYT